MEPPKVEQNEHLAIIYDHGKWFLSWKALWVASGPYNSSKFKFKFKFRFDSGFPVFIMHLERASTSSLMPYYTYLMYRDLDGPGNTPKEPGTSNPTMKSPGQRSSSIPKPARQSRVIRARVDHWPLTWKIFIPFFAPPTFPAGPCVFAFSVQMSTAYGASGTIASMYLCPNGNWFWTEIALERRPKAKRWVASISLRWTIRN